MIRALALSLAITLAAGLAGGGAANAQDAGAGSAARQNGPHSGLPLPRFVSLKADEVNVRRGPGWDHAIVWVFRRAGLPVEIIAESDVWRQIRDSEGATGWVYGTLLSGRRTLLVAPWQDKAQTVPLHRSASETAAIVARLSPGVLGDVKKCDGVWCEIWIGSAAGYVKQDAAWGVYPGETVN